MGNHCWFNVVFDMSPPSVNGSREIGLVEGSRAYMDRWDGHPEILQFLTTATDTLIAMFEALEVYHLAEVQLWRRVRRRLWRRVRRLRASRVDHPGLPILRARILNTSRRLDRAVEEAAAVHTLRDCLVVIRTRNCPSSATAAIEIIVNRRRWTEDGSIAMAAA